MAEEKKKSLGMDENIAGLLCYVAGWISGLVFFLLEKENKFVRFHALQSIYTFLGLTVAMFVMGFIPIIGAFVNFLLSLAGLIAWIAGMIKAYQKEMYKFPIVGDIVSNQL